MYLYRIQYLRGSRGSKGVKQGETERNIGLKKVADRQTDIHTDMSGSQSCFATKKRKEEEKVRDPSFDWQAGSPFPCHSFFDVELFDDMVEEAIDEGPARRDI